MDLQATYRQNNFSSVKEMDVAVQAHIYYNANKLPTSNRKILHAIRHHAFNPIGVARLKIATIAKEVGCSEATASRAIKRLKELHIIDVKQGTKLNGIQGSNYYRILPCEHTVTVRVREREMTERATHENPRSSKAEHVKKHTETINSFKQNFNKFVNTYSTYSEHNEHNELKEQLRAMYKPKTEQAHKDFEELCSIAFNLLRKGMERGVPYTQMTEITLRCMRQLVNKNPKSVNNPFALYSGMITRQTEQLFEAHIKPVQAFTGQNKELVPDWFDKRNEPVISSAIDVDFEAERAAILEKLNS